MATGEDRTAEEDEDMEIEAAFALAGLARSSGAGCVHCLLPIISGLEQCFCVYQDPTIAVYNCCGYTSDTVTIGGNCEQLNQTAGCQSNTASKSRQNYNEAEKEARKLRRIMANRESARQTIRRRQAMYQDLTKKAADLSAEYENLKKQKELKVKEFDSLKGRNKFLKEQMSRIKKAERGDKHEEKNLRHADASSSLTTNPSMFLHNQPSLIPCFLPSFLPSPDTFHYASHPEIMSSSQYLMPNRDTGQQTPFFVVPVPWLVPFLTNTSSYHANDRQNEMLSTHQGSPCTSSESLLQDDTNWLSLNGCMTAGASSSKRNTPLASGVRDGIPPDSSGQHIAHYPESTCHMLGLRSSGRPVDSIINTRTAPYLSGTRADAVSVDDHISNSLNKNNWDLNEYPVKNPEDVYVATEARKRRKELMKLKNTQCHNIHMH